MQDMNIRYCFTLPDGSEEIFNLKFDAQNLKLIGGSKKALPAWTALHFHQCSHCPLDIKTHPDCPIAVNLVNIVEPFSRLLSHNEIHVAVTTEERVISKDTTAQEGISSLIGLVMATSGCPHTAFFRPMARFHLPLASEEETVFRATSMYLLAQYFLKKEEQEADFELEGLTEIYHNVHVVNIAFAERLRGASEKDSTINAIVMLDMYALALPYVIEGSLEEIRYLFKPFLTKS